LIILGVLKYSHTAALGAERPGRCVTPRSGVTRKKRRVGQVIEEQVEPGIENCAAIIARKRNPAAEAP
jgi:hypothetical protein